MDTSLERIQAKIADLEAKIVNLKIAERELLDLEKAAVRKVAPPRRLAVKAKTKVKEKPKAEAEVAETADRPPQQTIGAAITDVLNQHGALSASAIAEQIIASGKDINNRAVSFALQAMKKRGLVKTASGEWSLQKKRSKR
jgi:ribosomal protein L9